MVIDAYWPTLVFKYSIMVGPFKVFPLTFHNHTGHSKTGGTVRITVPERGVAIKLWVDELVPYPSIEAIWSEHTTDVLNDSDFLLVHAQLQRHAQALKAACLKGKDDMEQVLEYINSQLNTPGNAH